ncbi:MAG: hypothetical protein ACRDHY_00415, partial [Anaerolineales bacterium]
MALAEAVRPGASNWVASWLAVYDALGIPVFGPGGTAVGTTGDDPIGPPLWRVWYMSGVSRPGFGFRLADFVKVFNSGGDPSFDPGRVGAALLDDLRAAVRSEDPQVRMFGMFTAEMVRRGPA